jgi:hypothetical protein
LGRAISNSKCKIQNAKKEIKRLFVFYFAFSFNFHSLYRCVIPASPAEARLAHGLEHLAHLGVLARQVVDLLDGGAGTAGDALRQLPLMTSSSRARKRSWS